jgi:hypothetical protein
MTGHGSVNGSTMTRMKKLAKNFLTIKTVPMPPACGPDARPTPATPLANVDFTERNAATGRCAFQVTQTYLSRPHWGHDICVPREASPSGVCLRSTRPPTAQTAAAIFRLTKMMLN